MNDPKQKHFLRNVSIVCHLLLLFSTSVLCAQTPEENPLFNGERIFSGGLVLGGNACQVDGDYLNGYHKLGFNAGAVGYVNFTKQIGASLELLYSQKGSYSVSANESPYFGSYFAKYSIDLNYVEMPVMLHYYATPRFHFDIGASYNVLVNSSEMYNDASYNVVLDPELYSFNKSCVDFLVGGSVVLWKGLMMNMRYQYSLTPVRKLEKIPAGLGFENQKNNMFALRLMYLF